MSKTKQIFVVGSSRSGTTMMGRILGNHKDIFTFNELHFFGTIWTNTSNQELSKLEQINLLSRLFCIQENGLFRQERIADFNDKAKDILQQQNLNALEIYALFLNTITLENSASISCEQTPKNMYYLEEILSHFPNAMVINLVRDQRDVLLSQKNKWKRKFLGASAIPLSEAIRSFVNYHPLLMSKVWASSLQHTKKYKNHNRVKIVKFEELVSNSEETIKKVCSFLDIDFQEEMLSILVIGSSTEADSKLLHIDSSKIAKWEKGGLSNVEIYLSQIMSADMMRLFHYDLKKFEFPPILIVFYLLTFPIKLGMAFFLNFHRMGNVLEVIKKRFLQK
ncbi:MAG: sulfotransferase family protein [Flavobacteriales bacterium]|tara:strand:+ start:5558 stop:6565 length:1008 start_codon:yes stop_codon:yes gene_type:complete